MLAGSGTITVPAIHCGAVNEKRLFTLIGPSHFECVMADPGTGRLDRIMEGLYLRTEAEDCVTGRAKLVRPEFVAKLQQSEHWMYRAIVPNHLADGIVIWDSSKSDTS